MSKNVTVVGAGLVGSLLSIALQRKGISVTLLEKRSDPRKVDLYQGRSINLALSQRGILALEAAGIMEEVRPLCTPMFGRLMHGLQGEKSSQPYGKKNQCINSISRNGLNQLLLDQAEKAGVSFQFGKKCESVDPNTTSLVLEGGKKIQSDLIIGTDGAYSMVRKSIQNIGRFDFSQSYIDHGYKEIEIPAKDGAFALEPDHLHIWPRGSFMLIALPNTNKTFTCTLFLAYEGENSFEQLTNESELNVFFKRFFPDVVELIPDLVQQFFENPTGSMVTTACSPWYNNRVLLLGDAAHSIVPFFGQGMNAGFEDTRIFAELAETENFNWDKVLPAFSQERKPNTDAIAELALSNFIEMRDLVNDERFLNRKKLEAKLNEEFPETWIPLYSMVTFSNTPYADALRLGKIQEQVMQEFATHNGTNLQSVIDRFNALKKA